MIRETDSFGFAVAAASRTLTFSEKRAGDLDIRDRLDDIAALA